ncbi:hypothetical protein [Melioribacter sp. OK-6-Me]|uniref:hypothetical protein n=1 Tax=unclassified Melioribacter TaxID=2627329 RepID=UPI003ED9FD93
MKRIILFCLIITTFFTVACEEEKKQPPEIPLSTLLAADDTLIFKNKKLILKTSIWYNKMPPIPEATPNFNILLTLQTTDSSLIDFPVDIVAYYLIRDNQVFAGLTSEEIYPNNFPYKYEKIGRDGPPDWEYESITVVALVTLEGKQSLLKAKNQFIDVAY